MLACSPGTTRSPGLATGELVDTVIREDKTILEVCQEVTDTNGEDSENVLSEAALKELSAERVLDVNSVLHALGASEDEVDVCESIELGECQELVRRTIATALLGDAGSEDERAQVLSKSPHLLEALGCGSDVSCAKGVLKAYLEDNTQGHVIAWRSKLVRALRLHEQTVLKRATLAMLDGVDLSFVVLVKMMELGRATEAAIEDATSSLGWFAAPARVALKLVAAEALAITYEGVLTLLEEKKALNRASLAREACRLWQQGDDRPAVATRFLKRAVLRLAKDPPFVVSCEGMLEGEARAHCEAWLGRARAELPYEMDAGYLWYGHYATKELELERQLAPRLVPVDWKSRYRDVKGLPDPEGDEVISPSEDVPTVEELSEALLASAEACDRVGDLSPACVRRASSVAIYYLDQNSDIDVDGLAGQIEALMPIIGLMDQRLEHLDKRIVALDHALEEHDESIEASLRDLRADVDLFVRKKVRACKDKEDEVIKRRWNYVNAVFSTKSLSSATWPADEIQLEALCKPRNSKGTLAASAERGLRLEMRLDDFCNGFARFDVGTSSAPVFGRCEDEPNADRFNPIVDELRDAIRSAQKEAPGAGTIAVTITGHTDGNEIKPPPCPNGATDNEELSEMRAKRVVKALENVEIAGVDYESVGRGTSDLVCTRPRNGQSPGSCDAQNRRFSVHVSTRGLFSMSAEDCD